MTDGLAILNKATQMLAEVRSVDEAKDLIDLAEAARIYARQVGLGLEAQNHAAEIKIRAQRRAGEILDQMEMNKGGRPSMEENWSQAATSLSDLGITKSDSSRWQTIASIPEKEFNEFIEDIKTSEKELTTAGVLREAHKPHVSFNSGNNEWYTPSKYIEAARKVMGEIDLDPASSDIANKIVEAGVYYTLEENGLGKEWFGRVWMNPPYSGDLISDFCEKLCIHFYHNEITEAIVLVNNATETIWFQGMLNWASAVCFPKGRVKFIDVEGNPTGAPLQGQAILYFGDNKELFKEVFEGFGRVLYG